MLPHLATLDLLEAARLGWPWSSDAMAPASVRPVGSPSLVRYGALQVSAAMLLGNIAQIAIHLISGSYRLENLPGLRQSLGGLLSEQRYEISELIWLTNEGIDRHSGK